MSNYCIITDCSNLNTPIPLNEDKIKISVNEDHIFTSFKDLEKFLFNKHYVRLHYEIMIDSTTREEYITKLENIEDKTLTRTKLRLNRDCCRIFLYKTDDPKNITLTQVEMLMIFPSHKIEN